MDSLTKVEALPMTAKVPPLSVMLRLLAAAPARVERAETELSKVSVFEGTIPTVAPPLMVMLPPEPAWPAAPETTTEPWVIVRPTCVFAAVRVSVFAPTFVRRPAPLTTPEKVRSPPTPAPLAALT